MTVCRRLQNGLPRQRQFLQVSMDNFVQLLTSLQTPTVEWPTPPPETPRTLQ